MPLIYKITYPNNKIYIGSDVNDSVYYFGSPNRKLLEQDFNVLDSITITKDILFHSNDMSRSELVKLEMDYILKYQSNNPKIGYNLLPKFKP